MADGLPSLRREFNRAVLPVLASDGFEEFSPKHYGRVIGKDVFQFLVLHIETGTHRRFFLEFGTMILAEPHSVLTLSPGGRFPDGRRGKSYVAGTQGGVERSLAEVQKDYRDTTWPWFRRCASVTGFIETFREYLSTNPHLAENGHSSFSLACAHSLAGDLISATTCCEDALCHFNRIFKERPVCTWAKVEAEKCVQFTKCLKAGTSAEMHNTWRKDSIASLKIGMLPSRR